MKLEDHTSGIGRIIVNLQSLEFVARSFLTVANQQQIEIPDDETTELPQTYMTNRLSLNDIVDTYNAQLSVSEQAHRIDTSVVTVRDALAHGRLLADQARPPLKLYKFANVNKPNIPIAYRALLNEGLDRYAT